MFARIGKMLDNGLLEETQQIFDYLQARIENGDKIDRTKGIWQSIGFKEMEPYLSLLKEDAESESLQKLKMAGLETMKIATRRYAKDQIRWIRYKTIPWLKEADALDHLFVLDSTDVTRWKEAVAEPAASLARRFLDGEQLPLPSETSETATEVLSLMMDGTKKDDNAPCHKTCEICQSTYLTEKTWEDHFKGNRHRRVAKRKKRSALVAVETEEIVDDSAREHATPLSGPEEIIRGGGLGQ